MTKTKLSDSEQVTQYIQNAEPALQPALEYLRQLILSAAPEIAEHIKWNAPAFYYNGEMKAFDPKEYKRDILVTNLRKGNIMCILPTGSVIAEHTAILEGNYADGRRMITFRNLDDIRSKEDDLIKVLREWLSLVEK